MMMLEKANGVVTRIIEDARMAGNANKVIKPTRQENKERMTRCEKNMLLLSEAQSFLVIAVIILTRFGYLRQFEYDGEYALFFLITGPLVSFSASIVSSFLIESLTLNKDNGWCLIVLLPGLFNITFVFIQNMLLGKIMDRILKWFSAE